MRSPTCEPNPATNRRLRANVVANALSSWTNSSSVLSTGYRTDRLDAASTAIRVRTIDLNERANADQGRL